MASITYKTFLMKGTGTAGSETYSKLVDIKDYPDLEGQPEKKETTTLSDHGKTFIQGLEQGDGWEFTANYDATDFATLKALKGVETAYAVWFGGTEAAGVVTPTGSEGKFSCYGHLSVVVVAGKAGDVREMKIQIANSTPIEFSAT